MTFSRVLSGVANGVVIRRAIGGVIGAIPLTLVSLWGALRSRGWEWLLDDTVVPFFVASYYARELLLASLLQVLAGVLFAVVLIPAHSATVRASALGSFIVSALMVGFASLTLPAAVAGLPVIGGAPVWALTLGAAFSGLFYLFAHPGRALRFVAISAVLVVTSLSTTYSHPFVSSLAPSRAVLVLGLDNVARERITALGQALVEQADNRYKVQLDSQVVSSIPATRFAVPAVYSGLSAAILVGLDSLSEAARSRQLSASGRCIPCSLANLGWEVNYISDDYSTAWIPRDLVTSGYDAPVGWMSVVRGRIANSFVGLGVLTGFRYRARGAGALVYKEVPRFFHDVEGALGAGASVRTLLFAHANMAHGPHFPAVSQLLGELRLALTPLRNYGATYEELSQANASLLESSRLKQRHLNGRFQLASIEAARDLISRLASRGYFNESSVLIYSDHADYFPGTSRYNYPGIHGMLLARPLVESSIIIIAPPHKSIALPEANELADVPEILESIVSGTSKAEHRSPDCLLLRSSARPALAGEDWGGLGATLPPKNSGRLRFNLHGDFHLSSEAFEYLWTNGDYGIWRSGKFRFRDGDTARWESVESVCSSR